MNPHVIRAATVNEALKEGLEWLRVAGVVNASRNGRVLVAPGPVVTVYERPGSRVMLSPLRDANPFFHLYECMWMLAGRNDAESVARFAKNMESFADDGVLHGAYGWRWREFFGFDQLKVIIDLLKKEPKTRRAVLTMWAPNGDLVSDEGGAGGLSMKDVPCNTHVYFDATTGVLNMTVCNRSNDAVWGAYGANAVHFSFLLEYMAAMVGMPMGQYVQFSNNFHVYLDRPDVQRLMNESGVVYQPDVRDLPTQPLLDQSVGYSYLEHDIMSAAEDPTAPARCYMTDFMRETFAPMMAAHRHYKQGDMESALTHAGRIKAVDWSVAATEWLQRRAEKRNAG